MLRPGKKPIMEASRRLHASLPKAHYRRTIKVKPLSPSLSLRFLPCCDLLMLYVFMSLLVLKDIPYRYRYLPGSPGLYCRLALSVLCQSEMWAWSSGVAVILPASSHPSQAGMEWARPALEQTRPGKRTLICLLEQGGETHAHFRD